MTTKTLETAIAALRKGRIVLVIVDKGDRVESAMVVAAAHTTEARVNTMVRHGRGLVCVALSKAMGERLNLQPQTPNSRHPRAEDVMVSVEARHGVTTGISAADRAHTITLMGKEQSRAEDLISPGHIIPVTVSTKGVFARKEVPEAAVDLARIAGFPPAATYCKLLTPEGAVCSEEDVRSLSKELRLPLVRLQEIADFRTNQEVLVSCETETEYDTIYGTFKLRTYQSDFDEGRHLALVKGDTTLGNTMIRVHSQCLTGDVFGSLRCDCGEQLDKSLEEISKHGNGALIYLLQEGRDIGLTNKVKAYALQDAGQDTVEANISLGFEADQRDFRVAAQILTHLGINSCQLLTNNPRKVEALEQFGVEVSARIPLEITPEPHTLNYLAAKKKKMGHLLQKV